jgi:lysozyme
MYRLSNKGIDLIKFYEGLKLKAYYCAAGALTIGYGSTGTHVYEGQIITKEEAEELLKKDLVRFEKAVNDLVTVPITQGIFDSLVSFTFNLGEGALAKSTLLRKLNNKEYHDAGREFSRWVYAGDKKLEGLVSRRNAEMRLYYSQSFPN